MKDVRTVDRIVVAVNGCAVCAALMHAPIATVLLITLSNLLLVRNLERVRTAIAREPVA